MVKNNKIKICFVIINVYPLFLSNLSEKTIEKDGVIGGAEINLYNLAKEMAKNDKYEISFLLGDFKQKSEENIDGIKLKKIKYMNVKLFKGNLHKIIRQISMIKEFFMSDADIYISSTASEILGWMALIMGKIKKKKIIFRLASDVNTDLNYVKKKSKKLFYFYRYGLFNSNLIIAQTNKQKIALKNNLNLDSNIIKNGFFIDKDTILVEKNFILWVSRAIKIKRPEIFVELAKRLKNEEFVMIMPGDSIEKENIKREAEDIDNLKIIDFVPFYKISEYYKNAKMLINTSIFEGFPNTFIQACLAKTPILSFNVNPDNFIQKYKLGYYCNDNIDKAEKFIKEFDLAKLSIYGSNALKYVKAEHDVVDKAKQYCEKINELIEE